MHAVSVVVWLLTAVLGANLLLRSGAFRGGPSGRSVRRRVLLAVHVTAAVCALVLWLWFLLAPSRAAGVLAGALLLVAAVHGLIMVVRWAPGFGRHTATGRATRRGGGYFPVHAAAIHAVAAGSTVTMVLLILTRYLT